MKEQTLLRDERIVTVGLSDTVIAGGNLRRRSLIVSSPPTNRITLRFSAPAVLDQGMTIYPATLPLQLTEGHVGSALREDVHAIAAVAPQTVSVVDVFEG